MANKLHKQVDYIKHCEYTLRIFFLHIPRLCFRGYFKYVFLVSVPLYVLEIYNLVQIFVRFREEKKKIISNLFQYEC